MRKAILVAATALTFSSPAIAADLPITPRSEIPGYEGEVQTYRYRTAPPVVVEEPAPVIVRRPVVVAPPPLVVEEYPVYAAPRVYATPPIYAYAKPVWRGGGWGHGHHFHGHW